MHTFIISSDEDDVSVKELPQKRGRIKKERSVHLEFLLKGTACSRVGKDESARENFEKVVFDKTSPPHIRKDACYKLGLLYQKYRLSDLAEKYFGESHNLDIEICD